MPFSSNTKWLKSLYMIAISESMDLDVRYAAARQMVEIRGREKPQKDIPLIILKGLMYVNPRRKAVHR